MDKQCSIEPMERHPTLTVRTRTTLGRLPDFLGAAFGSISAHMAEHGVAPAGPPFALYHNMDMKDLDVEAGIPLSRAVPAAEDMVVGEIPGGPAATCVHRGPYGTLGETYDHLTGWMQAEGLEGRGTAYEFYLDDPEETLPGDVRTRIAFPLRGSPAAGVTAT